VSARGDDALKAFGLYHRTKVQMLGSAVEEIGGLVAVTEDEKKRMEQIQRNRETQTRVRQVNSRV
jgi:hypothetical protein